MSPRYDTVLFDLDGTLIDHFGCIHRCYAHAMAHLGQAPVSYETIRAAVGGSISVTFGKLMPEALVPQAVTLYREEFDRSWQRDLHVLPGAEDLLRRLKERGVRTAIFTNKEGDRSRQIAAHTGLDRWLDAVIGTLDTPWRKPQPEFTRYALERLGADPARCCLVGDSPYDVAAAHAGAIPCHCVATGSHSAAQLAAEADPAESIHPDLASLGQSVFGL